MAVHQEHAHPAMMTAATVHALAAITTQMKRITAQTEGIMTVMAR
jgi:hypothetical protein